MKKKVLKTMYGPVINEKGVEVLFSKIHDQLGFPRIDNPATSGFDMEDIIYIKNEKPFTVTVEFEYESRNFLTHGHPFEMEKGKKYVLVCWEDNCNIRKAMFREHRKELFDVIELKDHVTLEQKYYDSKQDDEEKVGYILLSYNKKMAYYDFSAWQHVHCFRVKTTEGHRKFAKDHLSRGTKALFAQEGYIIGGFTVVRYEVIDCPRTRSEKELYKKLMDYPNSLFEHDLNEHFNEETFYRGHIFYENLFEINVKLDWKKYITDKGMKNDGYIKITKQQYESFQIRI